MKTRSIWSQVIRVIFFPLAPLAEMTPKLLSGELCVTNSNISKEGVQHG
jgi:hypothetical protein